MQKSSTEYIFAKVKVLGGTTETFINYLAQLLGEREMGITHVIIPNSF